MVRRNVHKGCAAGGSKVRRDGRVQVTERTRRSAEKRDLVQDAWNELHRRYGQRVYERALKKLGDRDAADSIRQQTFITVFEKIDQFRGESSLSAWIMRIGGRTTLNYVKSPEHQRRQRGETFLSAAPPPRIPEISPSSGPGRDALISGDRPTEDPNRAAISCRIGPSMLELSMRSLPRVVAVCLSLPLITTSAHAQATKSIVGTWQRFYVTNDSGVVASQAIQPYLTFGTDGYYAQIGFAPNRPVVNKAAAELTKEEFLARYQRSDVRFGKYTIANGKTLTRTFIESNDPARTEPTVQDIVFASDTLKLFTIGNKGESRWLRVK
ncbi:MAG: hypothetical protein HY700_06390 [Gemmatimonadetes bacterium]|nr:hypothetical protein [Gemmatimonadota bacterium]